MSIDATGKRKVDGSKAATRLGSSATEKWGNERFRQTMLLVREFRMEWPNSSLLTADDVESIRALLDCALYTATKTGHVSDIYDMNPTCWAIWLVQNQQALKAGGWYTHSADTQQAISFEGLYNWLKAQHGKHENRNLYDQVTKKRLKQYKLPFKVFTVPPLSNNLFKYVKGARRLSDWIYGCQESMDSQDRPRSMGFPYGIIAQKPPELVAAPPLAEAAVARRQAVWERVRARAHRQSVGLRTAQDGSEDAEQTRELVDAIVEESGEARDREAESTEGGGPSVSLDDIEHVLMEDSEEEEEGVLELALQQQEGKEAELVLQQRSHHRRCQHSRPHIIPRAGKEFPHMSLKGGKTYVVMNFIWSHLDCSSEYFQLPDLHRDLHHMYLRGLHAPRRE